MTWRRVRAGIGRFVMIPVLVLLVCGTAAAQQGSGISGVARDASGAVLPGVTVEASSPALIEKVRSVSTDTEGRYDIVELRPGTYTVTFSLAGFRTFRREQVELTAGFTATINAQMEIGALEETITVAGASPLVDTQNARQQRVISNQLLASLPTSTKALSNLIALIPGMTGNPDVGGASGIYTSNAPRINTYHGKVGVKYTFDGMSVLNFGAVGSTSYVINQAAAQEIVVATGGLTAEGDASGIDMNLVPKEGGNTVSFLTSGFYTDSHLQSNNLTDELRQRGLNAVSSIHYVRNLDASLGGPVMRDKLWFFMVGRASATKNTVPGVYFNKTQGTPFYTPDLDRPGYRNEWLRSIGGRATWQATPKNKFGAFYDVQTFCVCRGRAEFVAPEAQYMWLFSPDSLTQVTWSFPATSRTLLEAGASHTNGAYPSYLQPERGDNDFIVTESSTGFQYAGSYGNQTHTRARYGPIAQTRMVQRFALSHVTGSHSFKTGVQIQEGFSDTNSRPEDFNIGYVSYGFLRGVPNTITQRSSTLSKARMFPDLGAYVQDRWTTNRMTLNLGLRFNYFAGYVPEQDVPASRFLPARHYDRVDCVPCWTDLNPRASVSYDLFGNGKSAVKASIGRFVGITSTDVTSSNNPVSTVVGSVTRNWTDSNGNIFPDCDLYSPVLNGECGAYQNVNFGRQVVTTVWADDVIRGFGNRDASWDLSAEFQHEIRQGMALTAGYYRNWTSWLVSNNLGDLRGRVTDNQNFTPADYSPYCITAPTDSRLPNGGGYQVCGLYDVSPAKFGQVNNIVTQAANYGKPSRVSNYFGVNINTRVGSAVQLGGGLDTGKTVSDACYVVDSPQSLLYCHVETPWKAGTQFKMFGSFLLPLSLSVSGTYQDYAGPSISANYAVPNADIQGSLGRPLAACGNPPRANCTSTATVPLIAPQTMFEDRRRQLDVRVSKIFRPGGRARLQANVDVYNLFNASSVLGANATYGPSWLLPTTVASSTGAVSAVLEGRLVQFGGQLSF
jgi:hypothetical protein